MRVAVVALNKGRGSGQVARHHMRALVGAGHDVTSIHACASAYLPGVDQREVTPADGVLPVHEYLPGHTGPQLATSQMPAAQASRIIDEFEAAVDTIHPATEILVAHHANLSTVAVARVARRRSIPYVVFVHGTGIEPRRTGGYADQVWELIADAVVGAHGIIVTTEYVRDELLEPLIPVPANRILVLPCGIDLQEFRPTSSRLMRDRYRLPDRYVICPGAITEPKGTANVVAATTYYADLAPTIFIGDGELLGRLEAELGTNGRFLGFVSEHDKAGLINEATVLAAAPNKLEHFGIIYAEALAAGTVPVAYRGGGVESIITPHVGVLTDRNPAALGSHVRVLLENTASTTCMSLQARRRAEVHFDNDELSRQFVAWLTSIAAGTSRSAVDRLGQIR
jgi:glycosyltransferase involved in cell wall biosynthesis